MDPKTALTRARSILLVDYPGRLVPDSLARAGYAVFAHGGPQPDDYFAFSVQGETVSEVRTGVRPQHADLLYTYRPLAELVDILRTAKAVGAKTIWFQPDAVIEPARLAEGQAQVEAAGFAWISGPILDAL